jgi:predicted acyl esterase
LTAAGLTVTLLGMWGTGGAARAADMPLGMTCADETTADGVAVTMCSGLVPSFDGMPLDVDVTVPQGSLHNHLPLLLMVSGWGGDKTEYEAPVTAGTIPLTYHMNNVWYASRGYAVVTYSNRGFGQSCGPTVPPIGTCATGWTHVLDRRYELHDVKHLAGLFADAGVADPQRIGITGGSYGGMHSMLAAVEADRITELDGSLVPWRSPAGTPMHLAVSVPQYGGSDLYEAIVPNGRGEDITRRTADGIVKLAILHLLYADGLSAARYAPPGDADDPTPWVVGADLGEPYSSTHGLDAFAAGAPGRSAAAQDDLIASDVRSHTEVPMLLTQGWTDSIFPVAQGTDFAAKLLAADPSWPVALYLSDIGHQPAQNKLADVAAMTDAIDHFLDHYLMGVGPRPASNITARVTTCDSATGATYVSPLHGPLARHDIAFTSSVAESTTSTLGPAAESELVDPFVSPTGIEELENLPASCYTLPATSTPVQPAAAVWQWPVTDSFTMLGEPVVALDTNITGTDAELSARLWDVDPNGTRTLVDRGVYRYQGDGGAANITFSTFGNGWLWQVGHQVQLEVMQNDAPFIRPDNLPSSIAYHGVTLTMPTR